VSPAAPAPPGPLAAWIAAARAEVEAGLERLLPQPQAVPALLDTAMRYSLRAGGKRVRPLLALAAAEATARDAAAGRALALPAACAIELIHTYSLVHDDLPAMDDDTLRRGCPTSHVVFGEGLAILAGDGLLTEAFGLLAGEPTGEPLLAERRLRTIAVIAAAAGAAGMVGGQAIDLHAAGQVPDPSEALPHLGLRIDPPAPFDAARLQAMHARKTGALIRAAAVAGAVMAGAEAPALAAVADFATDLGLAFQIVDDVLDVEGEDATLGKTAGKDAAAGKPTYPALFGLDASRRLAGEALDRALAALDRGGIAGHLPGLARWIVHRTH
jgi:geranylgeranyl diphosphate synthase type II